MNCIVLFTREVLLQPLRRFLTSLEQGRCNVRHHNLDIHRWQRPEKVGPVAREGQAGGHSGLRLGRQAAAGGDGELIGGGGGAGGVAGGREAVDQAGPFRERGVERWG